MLAKFKVFCSLVKRNTKLYFKDKITFFMSLITPFILLILFLLFLKNTYVQSIDSIISAAGFAIPDKLKESMVASWFVSSILSTSAVTISFCSATIIVNDKLHLSGQDIAVTPISKSTIFMAYLCSTFISTMIIMLLIMAVGFIYIAIIGWYLSFLAVVQIVLSVVLLALFGSVLSCIIFNFVKSQGATSAVATLISSCYGFLSGAYMPLSQYPKAMASILGFNPGVYGNSILKYSFMNGAIDQMVNKHHLPMAIAETLRDSFDLNYYFFDSKVSILCCFLILAGIILILLSLFVVIAFRRKRKYSK